MKIASALAALALLALAPAALADTLKVPSQYDTIQAAVDAASSGDRIVVAAGNYTENVVVGSKTDLEIRGSGWPVLLGPGASLTVNGTSSGILVRGLEFDDALITAWDCSDVVLTKLRVHDNDNAISTFSMDGFLVSRCEFRDLSADAISDVDSDGYTIEKCRFEDLGGWAVGLTPDNSIGTLNAVISKNRIVNAAGGIFLGGTGTIVEKNRMEGILNQGVQCNGFNDSSGATISKNRIETDNGIAILVAYSGTTVEKNILVGGGILANGAAHILDRNRILGAASDGIVTNSACTLLQNSVRGAAGVGILVHGDLSVLERNSVFDSDSHGIVINTDDCDLDRNSVTRADTVGFLVDGTGNTLTGNRARGSVLFDLADTSAQGSNTYEGNHFATIVFSYVP